MSWENQKQKWKILPIHFSVTTAKMNRTRQNTQISPFSDRFNFSGHFPQILYVFDFCLCRKCSSIYVSYVMDGMILSLPFLTSTPTFQETSNVYFCYFNYLFREQQMARNQKWARQRERLTSVLGRLRVHAHLIRQSLFCIFSSRRMLFLKFR